MAAGGLTNELSLCLIMEGKLVDPKYIQPTRKERLRQRPGGKAFRKHNS